MNTAAMEPFRPIGVCPGGGVRGRGILEKRGAPTLGELARISIFQLQSCHAKSAQQNQAR